MIKKKQKTKTVSEIILKFQDNPEKKKQYFGNVVSWKTNVHSKINILIFLAVVRAKSVMTDADRIEKLHFGNTLTCQAKCNASYIHRKYMLHVPLAENGNKRWKELPSVTLSTGQSDSFPATGTTW